MGSKMVDIDYRTLVSQADLIYESPAEWSIEGTPVGNGRMGTMVWTTPSAVHFQINRCDVFAIDRYHAGHQYGACDYAGACAQVTLDVGDDVFHTGNGFRQQLSQNLQPLHSSFLELSVHQDYRKTFSQDLP
ncbi:MAG TPA: hypothetical protein EYO82_00055 [Gammaproteobacteria bacterium]|nr:hypothetical protein [Gammaproteobacteria bacterium]